MNNKARPIFIYLPVRLAYQPPANNTFLSEQTSHQQPTNNTFLSEQISTNHQPPAKRIGCMISTYIHLYDFRSYSSYHWRFISVVCGDERRRHCRCRAEVTEDGTHSRRRTCGSLVFMRSAVRSLRFQRMEDDALQRRAVAVWRA
jgi:hypothetical protein